MWAMILMFRVLASGYSRMSRPFLLGDSVCRFLVTCVASATVASVSSSFLAGIAMATRPPSPSIVGERAVRLRHLVHVLAALHRRALSAGGVHQLADQALGHG